MLYLRENHAIADILKMNFKIILSSLPLKWTYSVQERSMPYCALLS